MSTHLHLDLVGGLAGDMAVAALLDAGAPLARLRAALTDSGLPLTTFDVTRDSQRGMSGLRFSVTPEPDAPHRSWRTIRTMLHEASLPDGARALCLELFTALAEAEAAVHGRPPEDVHFHEIGAMDSIVDFVAVALAVDLLGVQSTTCSAVPICVGTVRTAHGVMPLPTPATARLLTGFPLVPVDGGIETVTPTGAAILAVLCGAQGAGRLPAMVLRGTGTGLGTALLPDRPNIVRALLGERSNASAANAAPRREAVVIEASIDDMDPRIYGTVAEQLFAAGALDVALVPLQMKKHRPGTLLTVVARPELEGVLTGVLLRETTTLGVRSWDVRRTELDRRHETVDTPWGQVRVKFGLLGKQCLNVSPEFEDCAQLARRHDVPVKQVLAAALSAANADLEQRATPETEA